MTATLSAEQRTLLIRLCRQRIDKLRDSISKAAGDLYPSIWAREINEIRSLFEALTGEELTPELE